MSNEITWKEDFICALSATVDGKSVCIVGPGAMEEMPEPQDNEWQIFVDDTLVAECQDQYAATCFVKYLRLNNWDAVKARKAFYSAEGPRFEDALWGIPI